MSTYNSIPGLSTGASSSEAMAMNFGSAHSQSMSMDVFDQDMTFDESLLDGAALQTLPFGYSYDLDAFSSAFEDHFSSSTRQ
ncbi:hypothetical protein QSH57_004558 [Fusarium oxysporum f. sp. vasinfectum]|nr:hypothetical protein QSH57_004558 [Fusarium oxysporum f. sp. vasinfectum]